ncbi:Hypothetical protein EPM1_0830 [Stenotrophomonas maltophilia EPM1]|nr:Hypothetical protein EPM1_0830 [Stenotrophomonas maltophilia EPM1]
MRATDYNGVNISSSSTNRDNCDRLPVIVGWRRPACERPSGPGAPALSGRQPPPFSRAV